LECHPFSSPAFARDLVVNLLALVTRTMDLPPGFVALPLKGAVLVIPERVYVAELRFGRTLRMASYCFGFCSR